MSHLKKILDNIYKLYCVILLKIATWPVSNRIRITIYRHLGIAIGKDIYIGTDLEIIDYSVLNLIVIGDRVTISSRVTLVVSSGPNNSKLKNYSWTESTPGIRVKILNNFNLFLLYLNSLNSKCLIFICDPISLYEMPFLYHMFDLPKIKELEQLKHIKESFFFFPMNNQDLSEFLKSLVHVYPSMLELVTLVPLNKIKATEEKILYVNFQIDQLGSTK